MDQASVGEIDILVPILPKDPLNRRGTTRKPNRNLERTIRDILKNGLRRPRKTSRQVTGFCNQGLAGDKRSTDSIESLYAIRMTALASIQQCNDNTGIQQNRLQPPNPRRCFLLEPRSETPEEN